MGEHSSSIWQEMLHFQQMRANARATSRAAPGALWLTTDSPQLAPEAPEKQEQQPAAEVDDVERWHDGRGEWVQVSEPNNSSSAAYNDTEQEFSLPRPSLRTGAFNAGAPPFHPPPPDPGPYGDYVHASELPDAYAPPPESREDAYASPLPSRLPHDGAGGNDSPLGYINHHGLFLPKEGKPQPARAPLPVREKVSLLPKETIESVLQSRSQEAQNQEKRPVATMEWAEPQQLSPLETPESVQEKPPSSSPIWILDPPSPEAPLEAGKFPRALSSSDSESPLSSDSESSPEKPASEAPPPADDPPLSIVATASEQEEEAQETPILSNPSLSPKNTDLILEVSPSQAENHQQSQQQLLQSLSAPRTTHAAAAPLPPPPAATTSCLAHLTNPLAVFAAKHKAPPREDEETTSPPPRPTKNLLDMAMPPPRDCGPPPPLPPPPAAASAALTSPRIPGERGQVELWMNEELYTHYERRWGLERDWAAGGLLATSERMAEIDRLVDRESEVTVQSVRAAMEARVLRASSHDGRLRLQRRLRLNEDKFRRWLRRKKTQGKANLDEMGSVSQRSESLYTHDSHARCEEELECGIDGTNLVWRRGFVIQSFLHPEEESEYDTYELEVFTLAGRVWLWTRQREECLNTMRIKFVQRPDGMALIRRSSYSSSGLFSLNLRINKFVKVQTTCIVAYRQPGGAHEKKGIRLLWSDDLGLHQTSDSIVAKFDTDIRRKLPLMAPLRVVQIRMRAEHVLRSRHMDPTRWEIMQMAELSEESDIESLHDTAWPRLAQRLDDLEWLQMEREVIHLRSPSHPTRLISCSLDQWRRAEEGGDEEANSARYTKMRFMGIMVPWEGGGHGPAAAHWRCLVLAPHREMTRLTEGRILNYRPLDALVRRREASLPEGWTGAEKNPYEIYTYDTESR